MESKRISKKLLGNLVGKLRIFFHTYTRTSTHTHTNTDTDTHTDTDNSDISVSHANLCRSARVLIFWEALKAWYLACFRYFSLKVGLPMCPKRSNGSQLSAWEPQKHCARAQIQA